MSQCYKHVVTQTTVGLLTRWLNSFGNKFEEEENFAILFHAMYINKFYYQQTVQRISVIHIHRRLLQHILAISHSHLQGTLIYRVYVWS